MNYLQIKNPEMHLLPHVVYRSSPQTKAQGSRLNALNRHLMQNLPIGINLAPNGNIIGADGGIGDLFEVGRTSG